MNIRSHLNILKLIVTISALSVLPFEIAFADYNSMLAPTNYTPSTYLAPKYDAFDNGYLAPVRVSDDKPDIPPVADFTVYTAYGLPNSSGTTATQFTFDATASADNETDGSRLEVRWDFENDKKLDSYFSVVKNIRHTFKKAGTYQVRLDVLDKGGNVSSTVKTVTVVNNTSPIPFFSYRPLTGTENAIFSFDTSHSRDDQYFNTTLVYRFDWDSDGKWDTSFQQKTAWYHRFNGVGNHRVTMEVKDPEGQKAQFHADIATSRNNAPTADFTVQQISKTVSGTSYNFNATASHDDETIHNRLWYRWDFNYNGPDDIIYDSLPSYADRATGYYTISGHKVIRLEVTDEDGAKAYSYAEIDVP